MSSAITSSIAALKDRLEILPTRGGKPTLLFQLAVTLWIVFTVACGVKAVISPVKHNSFDVFQAGSELWLADMNMYKGTHHEFRYGPTFAFLFAPIALLPMALGSLVWMCFNIIVLFRALRLLVREILPGDWTANQEGVFLMLVLPAAYRGLWTAQTNALIFACLVVALHAILERRWICAALFLALPVHIKIWPVAAALLLIVCWPRQLAARFLAVMLAVAALPMLAKWPSVVAARYAEWYAAIVGPMQIRHTYRDMWTVIEAFCPPLESAYFVLQLSTALLVLRAVHLAKAKTIQHAATIDVHLGDLGLLAIDVWSRDRAGHVRTDRAADSLGPDHVIPCPPRPRGDGARLHADDPGRDWADRARLAADFSVGDDAASDRRADLRRLAGQLRTRLAIRSQRGPGQVAVLFAAPLGTGHLNVQAGSIICRACVVGTFKPSRQLAANPPMRIVFLVEDRVRFAKAR